MSASSDRVVSASRVPGTLAALCGFAAVGFGLWELLTRTGAVPPHLMPPFSEVAQALWHLLNDAEFRDALATTSITVLVSYGLAAPAALATGLLLGSYFHALRPVREAFSIMLGVPQSIFLPLFVLLLGIGLTLKVVFGFLHAFFVISVVTASAVRSVPPSLIQMSRAFGATPLQVVTRVIIPAMLPLVATGLRIGLIFTIIGIIVAEMYASTAGLGHFMLLWGELYELPNLMAAILLVSALAIVGNEALRLLERRAWLQQSAAWGI